MSKTKKTVNSVNEASSKHSAAKWVVLVLVALAAIAFIVIHVLVVSPRSLNGPRKIDSEESFVNAIKSNSQFRKYQTYSITDSFEVSVDKLPDAVDFYGILQGNGNTVTVVGDKLSHPIFNVIKQGAAIGQVNFLCKAVLAADEDKGDVAMLASINNGKIANCDFKLDSVVVGGCNNTSAVVNYNFGVISNVCLQIDNVAVVQASEVIGDSSYHFGAVATVNYATVTNVLADVSFDRTVNDYIVKQTNDGKPHNVGYLLGDYVVGDGISVKHIYVLGKDADTNALSLWDKVVDTQSYSYKHMTYDQITKAFNDELRTQADDKDRNWFNYWKFNDQGGQFPTLNISKIRSVDTNE